MLPAWVLIALTLAVVVLGLVLAWRRYAVSQVPVVPPLGTALTRAARVDLYQDSVNDALLVEPGQHLTRSLVFADRAVVDGTVTGVGRATVGLGDLARRVQTGYVRSYAATTVIGLIVLVVAVLVTQS